MWTTIFFASVAILCVLSLAAAIFAVRFAARMTGFPPAALASIESKLRSIESSHLETMETVSRLAQKYKMQKVRNALDHSSDPIPADPGDLKAHLRRRAGLVAGRPAPHKEN